MNDPDILKLVKEQEDYLIKMRRYFHMNPELSNKEFETRKTLIIKAGKMLLPSIWESIPKAVFFPEKWTFC